MKKTFFQLLQDIKDYQPKNNGFTSKEETDMLIEKLELNTMSKYDLQNLRDMTVLIYNSRMDGISSFSKEGASLMNSMLSVTSVIDERIFTTNN